MTKSQLGPPRPIRFDEKLEEAIINAAKAAADSSDLVKSRQFSKTVRRLCRESLAGSSFKDLDLLLERLETIRRQIAPVGSNLNQIATGFNTDGSLDAGELAGVHSDLQKQFAEITSVLKELRNGVIRQIR